MVLIFNNAATCHAYESGGGLSAQRYEWEPKKKKMIFFFPSLSLQLLQGGSAYIRGKTDCSVIVLRRLLLCNFTQRDKQIKTYYLGGWSAVRQEIGSFSPHKRMISGSLPSLVNPINLSSWQGDMAKWTTPSGLSWVKDEQRWRIDR